MLTKTAIEHFGSQAEICRRLGLSSAAIAKWGDIVPIESALAIELLTNKVLVVDPALYPRLAAAIDAAGSAQSRKRANA